MMVRDTPAFVFVYFGLMKIGAVPVGLSTRLAPQDTAYTIDDSKSGFFVLDVFFKDHFEEALTLTRNLPRIVYTDTNISGSEDLEALMVCGAKIVKSGRIAWVQPSYAQA